MEAKYLLIDGHSILSRAFYGIPMLTNSKGVHTNAVYGFLTIMLKAIEEESADHLAVAFDLERSKLLRTKRYPEYKGTRKPMPEELHEQVPLIQKMLSAMNIPILTKEGYEADDILGTLAKRAAADGAEVTILSGDRDLLQLADTHIKISIPKTSRGRTEVFHYYPEDLMREKGVTPTQFIDVKALMGDSSDNIPGVPGIGEKMAFPIIQSFGSIENAYAHIDEVTPPRARKALSERYDLAVLSKELATIDTNVPVDFSGADAEIGQLYTEEALALCREFEFKSLIPRFAEGMEAGSAGGSSKNELSLEGIKLVRSRSMLKVIFADAVTERAISLRVYAMPEPACSICLAKDRIYAVIPSESYPQEELLADLRAFAENLLKHNVKVYTMGLKEQLKILPIARSASWFDLSLAAYLLNPLKDSYSYDDLARDFLDAGVPGQSELLGKKALSDALSDEYDPLFQKAVEFLGWNAYIPYLAAQPMRRRLKEQGMQKLYEEIEEPLIYSLNDMELAGVSVNKAALDAYAEKLVAEISEVEKAIYADCSEIFNINSPAQLGMILFERLGIKGGKKTKTGFSTAADVLTKLAPDYPVVERVLRYRALTKLYSTYAVGLTAFICPDGRIHGTFNQTVTATGRISSTEPNLQNIPVRTEEGKEIRRVFVPEEGYVFVDADYSQVELRILAALSGDERLIAAYRDAVDIHSLTASEVFHVPLDAVTPEQRRNAKAVNFGIVYGISAFGLGEDLSISRKEAQDYINRYFETYPSVKEYLDKQVLLAKEQGYVTTAYGRIRPVPEIRSSNFMQRSFGERVAMNSPIQGTAADVMKLAMNRVNMELSGLDREGRQTGKRYRSRIVLQVHDELLIETAPEELSEVKALVQREMESATASVKALSRVKLSVDVRDGKSWYDCH